MCLYILKLVHGKCSLSIKAKKLSPVYFPFFFTLKGANCLEGLGWDAWTSVIKIVLREFLTSVSVSAHV